MAERPRGSLQARMSENDPRLYSVNRDVAHNFKEVMEHVLDRLQQRKWSELEEFLTMAKVPDEEVGKAFDALCLFIGRAQEDMRVSFQDSLERSGWNQCHPGAQVAVMAILGTVILGYHWTGVREATLGGEGPALGLQELARQGGQLARYLAMPRWKRWLFVRVHRVKQGLKALRGV